MNYNPPFKQKINTSQNNPPTDRSRHQSQNQSVSPNHTIERTTKTHCNLRNQPKIDYRHFMPPSKL